jgi:hypothetical protein
MTIPYQARALFAGRDNVTGEPIFVREGVKGYWKAEGFDPDAFNKRQGWTDEEAESAVMASCFGWNVPIAARALAAIKRELNRDAETDDVEDAA